MVGNRLRGVHIRQLHGLRGIKVVYEARFTPPLWNGKKVPRLHLGQFATAQEAHNKFLIAAFYYNRDAGLLDGWFQVPPMSEEERSLPGEEKRKWVIGQAKKVYEDFKKKTAEAMEKELVHVSQVENSGMGMATLDNHDLECASHSFDGMHEGLALSIGHGLGFGEGSALPVSQLPPNTENGMNLNGSDQVD